MRLPRIFRSSLQFSKGFTITEMLVVMTVIATLATMALYGLNSAQVAARDAGREQIMTGLQTALERYYSDNQTYPNTASFNQMLTTLKNAGVLATDPLDPNKNCTALAGVSWTPCTSLNPPNARPRYSYWAANGTNCRSSGGGGQDYQLTLEKESGVRKYFCPPN